MAAEEKKMQQMRELFLANPALLSRVRERAEILITTTRFYILTMLSTGAQVAPVDFFHSSGAVTASAVPAIVPQQARDPVALPQTQSTAAPSGGVRTPPPGAPSGAVAPPGPAGSAYPPGMIPASKMSDGQKMEEFRKPAFTFGMIPDTEPPPEVR